MSGRNKEKLQQHGNIGQKWDQGKGTLPGRPLLASHSGGSRNTLSSYLLQKPG